MQSSYHHKIRVSHLHIHLPTGLTMKFPATGGWKTPLKEHWEKGQEETLKSPETRSRQRATLLVPDRLTMALLLKVWGR